MKAIVQERFGPPDVLRLVDTDPPEVGRRRRAGSGARRRAQPLRLAHPARRPARRAAHGRSGADQAEGPGGRASTRPDAWRRSARTCAGCGPATRCSASARARSPSTRARQADKVVPKPASLTFEQAAAVPMAGTTALRGIRDVGAVRAGHRVLVNGAAGGVGTYAVQIAAALGARGHRGVQHTQRRAGALDRRRARRRLHDGGLHRRAGALRRDPRQRGQPAAEPAAPGPDPDRDPRAQRRRLTRPRVRAGCWHPAGGRGQRVSSDSGSARSRTNRTGSTCSPSPGSSRPGSSRRSSTGPTRWPTRPRACATWSRDTHAARSSSPWRERLM